MADAPEENPFDSAETLVGLPDEPDDSFIASDKSPSPTQWAEDMGIAVDPNAKRMPTAEIEKLSKQLNLKRDLGEEVVLPSSPSKIKTGNDENNLRSYADDDKYGWARGMGIEIDDDKD